MAAYVMPDVVKQVRRVLLGDLTQGNAKLQYMLTSSSRRSDEDVEDRTKVKYRQRTERLPVAVAHAYKGAADGALAVAPMAELKRVVRWRERTDWKQRVLHTRGEDVMRTLAGDGGELASSYVTYVLASWLVGKLGHIAADLDSVQEAKDSLTAAKQMFLARGAGDGEALTDAGFDATDTDVEILNRVRGQHVDDFGTASQSHYVTGLAGLVAQRPDIITELAERALLVATEAVRGLVANGHGLADMIVVTPVEADSGVVLEFSITSDFRWDWCKRPVTSERTGKTVWSPAPEWAYWASVNELLSQYRAHTSNDAAAERERSGTAMYASFRRKLVESLGGACQGCPHRAALDATLEDDRMEAVEDAPAACWHCTRGRHMAYSHYMPVGSLDVEVTPDTDEDAGLTLGDLIADGRASVEGYVERHADHYVDVDDMVDRFYRATNPQRANESDEAWDRRIGREKAKFRVRYTKPDGYGVRRLDVTRFGPFVRKVAAWLNGGSAAAKQFLLECAEAGIDTRKAATGNDLAAEVAAVAYPVAAEDGDPATDGGMAQVLRLKQDLEVQTAAAANAAFAYIAKVVMAGGYVRKGDMVYMTPGQKRSITNLRRRLAEGRAKKARNTAEYRAETDRLRAAFEQAKGLHLSKAELEAATEAAIAAAEAVAE